MIHDDVRSAAVAKGRLSLVPVRFQILVGALPAKLATLGHFHTFGDRPASRRILHLLLQRVAPLSYRVFDKVLEVQMRDLRRLLVLMLAADGRHAGMACPNGLFSSFLGPRAQLAKLVDSCLGLGHLRVRFHLEHVILCAVDNLLLQLLIGRRSVEIAHAQLLVLLFAAQHRYLV